MGDGKRSDRTGGGKTSWDSMSYEQMLAWLEQAHPSTVQAAAERLGSAAKEIESIGEELKIRPQYVSWKGEGADAFRLWGADLANATLRLGHLSKESAQRLGDAASMIIEVKAAFPRYTTTAEAQANLDAAEAARNDPDADKVARKSADELKALAAEKEHARQEAVRQMEKLAGGYQKAANEMDGLVRPKFPPPPREFRPGSGRDFDVVRHESSYPEPTSTAVASTPSPGYPRGSSADAGRVTGPGPTSHLPQIPGVGAGTDMPGSVPRPLPEGSDPVGMEIDATAPLPETLPPSGRSPADLPTGGRPDLGVPRPVDGLPPTVGGGPPPMGGRRTMPGGRPPLLPGRGLTESIPGRLPNGSGPIVPGGQANPREAGRSLTGGRPPMFPGPGPTGPAAGPAPRNNGIVGGRPVPPPPTRPTGGLPRGTVIGGETPGTHGRGPVGHAVGSGTGGTDAGRRGGSPQRRPAIPSSGIVGGRPQQGQPSGARTFTTGGSGLVRHDDERDNSSECSGEGQESGRRPPRGAEPPVVD